MSITLFLLRLAHILASAAMFGAMFYSFTLIHPRARKFFQNPQDFEEFITFISSGARWKVLGGFALIGSSGLALAILNPADTQQPSHAVLLIKSLLLMVAIAFFCFVSWKLWPQRIFATPEEVPRFQRLFRWVALVMISLVTIEFVISIAGHVF